MNAIALIHKEINCMTPDESSTAGNNCNRFRIHKRNGTTKKTKENQTEAVFNMDKKPIKGMKSKTVVVPKIGF